MHIRSPLARRRARRIPLFDWELINPFVLISATDAIARGIEQERRQVGAHSDARLATRAHPIGDMFIVRRAAIVAVAIAMMSAPIAMPFASPAYAESDPASVARLADPYGAFVAEASLRFGVRASWLRAVMRAESRGNVHAISPKGAMGLMQIMPSTWTLLRVRLRLGANPYDPRDNILAGAAFLRELHDRYGSPGFLAAYNAGPGRYENHLATGRPLPAETRAYVAALAPLIDDDRIDHTVLVAAAARSWTAAPLFIGQDDSAPAVDPASPPTPPNQPSDSRRVVDVSALVPRSESLFVQLSAREPMR
jgi:soluble lytic murein transglycosylase-like protein